MRKSLFLKSLMTIVLLGGGAALAQPAAGGRAGTFLTPEQRAMFVEQAREQTQNMTAEQRRSWRRDQFTRLAAMSDADKAKLKADMQARWDALPQARKDQVEQRIAARAHRSAPPPAPDMNPNQGQAVAQ